MSWALFHKESEQFSIEAQLALKAGSFNHAAELYKKAASAEKKALDCVDKTKVRTRGITAVSATALWYKAGEYAAAEKIAYSMLADEALPEFAREELRNLVQAIWTESAKRQANVAFIPEQVMVSVQGGEVVTGGAPLDLIVDKVKTIQAMFYRTIEYLQGVAHRKIGLPSKELQESCRPWLFQSPPGSYQFSVAIQKPKQQDFFKEEIEPDRIAQHFLEIVSASTNDDENNLVNLVSDKDYRITFLNLARNLTPTGNAFDRIELRGLNEAKPIRFDADTRHSIRNNLKKLRSPISAGGAAPEELQGILRAVHLDQDWLEIAVGDKKLHVVGLQEAVDDVIGPMVNRAVVVKVVRLKAKLKFIDIELAE